MAPLSRHLPSATTAFANAASAAAAFATAALATAASHACTKRHTQL